jgi:methylglutaconyl-CoA hydratase
MTHVLLNTDERDVAWLTLNRPDVRNALDAELIAGLADTAARLAVDTPRAVVLSGNGPSFSAGADIAWMRSMKEHSREENLADARATAAMFRALDELPCAVVGRVHGHAFGGGAGLVAVCDVVVADLDTIFGFTEVQLGIAPAVISPYVVRKIGRSHARALFVTGERFDAEWAEHIGLVHMVVDAEDLDGMVDAVITKVLSAGPGAVAAAKRLPDLAWLPGDEATEATAAIIADLRAGDEGQEGMAAFFERRRPRWAGSVNR